MSSVKPILSAVVAALSLAAWSAPASAATAHNSQAGAYGSTTNPCAATAYFPAGSGCLSSYIERGDDDGVFPPPYDPRLRYRPRPPLE